jgi:hypothetical protein
MELDRRKLVTFGLLGAVGCLAGWILGEGFLAVAMQRVQQEQESPSLASRPDPLALAPTREAVPPPPPLPKAPVIVATLAPPPPPLPELKHASAAPPPAEFKERLDRSGAQTGDVQISLVWNNTNDLDLHCIDPAGEEIYFQHRRAASGGELDVDKNAGLPLVNDPVENIFWPSGKAPDGRYRVFVNHYARHARTDPTAFKISVLADGQRQEFDGRLTFGEGKRLIHEFTLSPALRLAVPSEVVLNPGGSNRMHVRIARSRFAGSVPLRLEGDVRDLRIGEAEVPRDQDDAILELSAGPSAESGPRHVRLVAETDKAKTTEEFVVQVVALPPVLRVSAPPEVVLIPGTENTLRVRVSRERLASSIRLRCEGDLEALSIADVDVPENEDEVTLKIIADSLADGGIREIQLVASAAEMTSQTTFRVDVKPMPPVLRMSVPREVLLRPKSSNTVPVLIARERFQGPVRVEPLANMDGVALAGAEITEGCQEGELNLLADRQVKPGRRTLRLQAVSGPFRAEADLDVVVPSPPPLPWLLVLVIGTWTGLLATGLAFALAGGQSWYLSHRWLPWRQTLILIGGGMLAGVVAGGIGQFLFSVLSRAEVMPQLGFLIGWGLLGALMGRGIGFFVPNLHGGKAALAGTVGGVLGATAFLGVSAIGDFAGRFVGAAILGALIGVMIAVVESVARAAWLEIDRGRERVTVNLGSDPVRVGSHGSQCTVFARGVRPVAASYRFVDGTVRLLDYATEIERVVPEDDSRQYGDVKVTVRTARSAAATGPRSRVLPPPPPPPGRSAGRSATAASSTVPTTGARLSGVGTTPLPKPMSSAGRPPSAPPPPPPPPR